MPQNITFILVRPCYLGNIGAVARVMKNFGYESLRFVAPPKNYKDAEARKMSVGAFDILKNSQVFETLNDALKDVSLAIGTTSGQQRQRQPISLIEVSPQIANMGDNRVAIVLGDERNGLLKDELERCHMTVTIPTNPDFPALNMAQAAGVIAYELARESLSGTPAEQPSYPTGAEDDELINAVDSLLEKIQFVRTYNRENIISELRTLYQRARPTTREIDVVRGIIRKLHEEVSR